MEDPFLVLRVYVLCLKMALLAGQLIMISDGSNYHCLLASVMLDWTGGLYRLTSLLILLFLHLLLSQMETDVTRSATFSVKPPRLPGLLLLAQRDARALRLSSERL